MLGDIDREALATFIYTTDRTTEVGSYCGATNYTSLYPQRGEDFTQNLTDLFHEKGFTFDFEVTPYHAHGGFSCQGDGVRTETQGYRVDIKGSESEIKDAVEAGLLAGYGVPEERKLSSFWSHPILSMRGKEAVFQAQQALEDRYTTSKGRTQESGTERWPHHTTSITYELTEADPEG